MRARLLLLLLRRYVGSTCRLNIDPADLQGRARGGALLGRSGRPLPGVAVPLRQQGGAEGVDEEGLHVRRLQAVQGH